MENILIGIDPGVNTGVAIWLRSEKRIVSTTTCSFWDLIKTLSIQLLPTSISKFTVFIEDVSQNKPVFQRKGQNTNMMQKISQNVGSNKRDCQLIIEWLERNKIEVVKVKPTTYKWDYETCKKITGYTKKCSQHARDAIKLIYGI